MNRPLPTAQSNLRAGGAEFVGTTVLMIIGPGSAIIASDKIGVYGIAFAFGLALLGMAYTIGHVSAATSIQPSRSDSSSAGRSL
jgi:glycerol uptake facilitator-like aquaporin